MPLTSFVNIKHVRGLFLPVTVPYKNKRNIEGFFFFNGHHQEEQRWDEINSFVDVFYELFAGALCLKNAFIQAFGEFVWNWCNVLQSGNLKQLS